MNQITEIGIPRTVGEIRKMIEQYPDDMPLNFLNQPAQALYYSESETLKFVCFQESVAEHQMLVQRPGLQALCKQATICGKRRKITSCSRLTTG